MSQVLWLKRLRSFRLDRIRRKTTAIAQELAFLLCPYKRLRQYAETLS